MNSEMMNGIPGITEPTPKLMKLESEGDSAELAAAPEDVKADYAEPVGPILPVPIASQGDQAGPLIAGPGAKKEPKPILPAKLTSSQQENLNRAKKYAMEQSIKSVLVKQTIAHHQTQMAQFQTTVQRQQALALICRIYVGSINYDIKEDTIKQAFLPFGPIKSVTLSWDPITNKHKGFAFIEYDIPEAAQLGLEQMNGVMIGGRNIKIGRPTNMPQAQPFIEQLHQEAQNFNRIYVASIHPDLQQTDVRSVFEAFGKIIDITLPPDPTRPGKHRGYGYIEYETAQAVLDAVNSMNLFDLGGQFLRVGKACTPPYAALAPSAPSSMPTAAAVAAAAVTAKITAMDASNPGSEALPPPGLAIPQLGPGAPPIVIPGFAKPELSQPSLLGQVGLAGGMSNASSFPAAIPPPTIATSLSATMLSSGNTSTPQQHQVSLELTEAQKQLVDDEASQSLEQQEQMKIKGSNQRHMIMQKLMRKKAESRVMVLRNMVGAEDLDEELETEVTEECGRYGNVSRVIIYQEKQSEDEDAEIVVKIFVEFVSEPEMNNAIKSLNGRYFGGRIVIAQRYDQDMYDANELSG